MASLLTTSKFGMFSGTRSRQAYTKYNVLYVTYLVAATRAAMSFSIPGLGNTTLLFALLWMLQKLEEHMENTKARWPVRLGVSVLIWRAALWCHTHPQAIEYFTHW